MTPAQRFHVDASGRWSGGGAGVLANLAFAAERSDILTLDPVPATIALLPRNVPTQLGELRHRFVWMPQNALPWGPPSPAERLLQRKLRIASEATSLRALAMVRISGAIPPLRGRRPTSEVLHNVLDEGFEAALPQAVDASGSFVGAGSAHGYRRFSELVDGYARYRATGGRTELILQTTRGTNSVEAALKAAVSCTPGVSLRVGGASRAQVLALMAGSLGVLLPSDVEASPITLLEARALGRPVACSAIQAHDELLDGEYAPRFTSANRDSVALAFHALDDECGAHPHRLQDLDVRAAERHDWADRLTGFLDDLD